MSEESRLNNPNLEYDEYGVPWEIMRDGSKRTPMKTNKSETTNGFTTYDTSRGHCAFCGRLECNGRCFK